MKVVSAAPIDFDPAIGCLLGAFETDGHMQYLFGSDEVVRRALVREFFSTLLAVRFALEMPVLVLKNGDQVVGLVMGYNTRRLEWPSPLTVRWGQIWKQQDGLALRYECVERASAQFKPSTAHYYLGAIGVDPSWQGQGVGSALIDAFCEISDHDPISGGIYLETGEKVNADYYQARGFRLLGTQKLDSTFDLHCLFRPGRMEVINYSEA